MINLNEELRNFSLKKIDLVPRMRQYNEWDYRLADGNENHVESTEAALE